MLLKNVPKEHSLEERLFKSRWFLWLLEMMLATTLQGSLLCCICKIFPSYSCGLFCVTVSNIGLLLVPVTFAYPLFALSISKFTCEGRVLKFSGEVSHLSLKFSTTDWNFLQTKRRGWEHGEEEGKRK